MGGRTSPPARSPANWVSASAPPECLAEREQRASLDLAGASRIDRGSATGRCDTHPALRGHRGKRSTQPRYASESMKASPMLLCCLPGTRPELGRWVRGWRCQSRVSLTRILERFTDAFAVGADDLVYLVPCSECRPRLQWGVGRRACLQRFCVCAWSLKPPRRVVLGEQKPRGARTPPVSHPTKDSPTCAPVDFCFALRDSTAVPAAARDRTTAERRVLRERCYLTLEAMQTKRGCSHAFILQ